MGGGCFIPILFPLAPHHDTISCNTLTPPSPKSKKPPHNAWSCIPKYTKSIQHTRYPSTQIHRFCVMFFPTQMEATAASYPSRKWRQNCGTSKLPAKRLRPPQCVRLVVFRLWFLHPTESEFLYFYLNLDSSLTRNFCYFSHSYLMW